MKIRQSITGIEARRDSRVLVLACSNLELDLLPALYDTLRELGRAPRLDVVLSCRGGLVNAARRIALLLRDFTDHLAFIVPHHCESAGTLAVLAGHEIVAGPVALFSPIDPSLQTAPSADGPPAICAEDVRLFGEMSRDWFGLPEDPARSLSVLCENIFPTTLTAFYRATLEVQAIGAELLALHMPQAPGETRSRIVDALLFGHHSHGYALTREELAQLGLPVRRDPPVEDLAWQVAGELRGEIGGGARRAEDHDWFDAIVATREGAQRRRRSPTGPAPAWEAEEIE